MTSREKFEAWMTDEQWFHGSDFEWDERRNCYAQFGIHLAYKAFLAAEGAAEQKLTDMAVQLANAESKCRELAAENEKRNTHSEALAVDNAALREVVERMVNQFAMSGISPEEKSINPAKSLMFDAKSALFMPATDANLAEVRAQGVDLVCDYHKSRCEALRDVDRNGSQRHGAALCDAIDIAYQLRKGAAL